MAGCKIVSNDRGWNSSVCSVLGSLSGIMQHHRFDLEASVEEIFSPGVNMGSHSIP